MSNINCTKTVFCSYDVITICNNNYDLGEVSPSSHVFLHANDASKNHETAIIRIVDTDILVIVIAMFPKLNLEELRIAFETGKRVPTSTQYVT